MKELFGEDFVKHRFLGYELRDFDSGGLGQGLGLVVVIFTFSR